MEVIKEIFSPMVYFVSTKCHYYVSAIFKKSKWNWMIPSVLPQDGHYQWNYSRVTARYEHIKTLSVLITNFEVRIPHWTNWNCSWTEVTSKLRSMGWSIWGLNRSCPKKQFKWKRTVTDWCRNSGPDNLVSDPNLGLRTRPFLVHLNSG